MADSGMSEQELLSLLDRLLSTAVSYANTDRKQLRELAIKYVNGEVEVIPPDGKSKVVSHDVADTLHWILPSLLRVFLSSERIVIYEPRRPEIIQQQSAGPDGQPVLKSVDVAEDRAKQATDYINYCFMTECDGYKVLHSAAYDSLLTGNGVIKHWWDDSEESEFETYSGLSDDAFFKLIDDPDVEVVEHTEVPDESAPQPQTPGGMSTGPAMPPMPSQPPTGGMAPGMPGQMPGMPGMAPPTMLHDVKIKRITSYGRLAVRAMPNEEFVIGPNDLVIDEKTSLFCAHVYRETRSDLRRTYKNKASIIDNLPVAGALPDQEEKYLRGDFTDEVETERATQLIDVSECYVRCDYDGDGFAEWNKVVLAGRAGAYQILDFEPWGDDLPFTDLVPDPVPHRWRGRSIFDETRDLQLIKSTLMRQTLDNLYMTNNPQKTVLKGAVDNMEPLLDQDLGAVVEINQPGAVNNLPVEFTAQASFSMLDYLDSVREMRTGISRATQALDLDAMQNQTATAVNAQRSASYTKLETYARNIAEVGLKRLFRCLLHLVVQHQDRPRMIRLRGKFVEMDPRAWHADMDVSINTGLGSGTREGDLAALSNILGLQQQAVQVGGPNNPLAGLDKISFTCRKLVETAGIKNPDQFFNEIGEDEMQKLASQPPPPDPKMIMAQVAQFKAQADAQVTQQKSQADLAIQQSEHQSNQIRAMAEIEKARAEAQVKLIEANSKAREAELQARETELQQRLAVAQIQLERMKANAANQTTLAKAAIDNLVRLEIARINASKDTDQRPDAVEQRLSADAGVPWHQANNVQPPQVGQ